LNLVIDEGNTLIKVAVYDGGKQQFFEAFAKDKVEISNFLVQKIYLKEEIKQVVLLKILHYFQR